jgi:general secretion pathway protein D
MSLLVLQLPPLPRARWLAWRPRTARVTACALVCTLLTTGLMPPPALAQRSAAERRAPVTVDFVNTNIEAVARAFSAMLNRPIAVDPRVQGSITVYSDQPQSVARAYMSFLAALRALGFSMVESNGQLLVLPEADAKLQSSSVSVGAVPRLGDEVITQVFNLRFENANNLIPLLRPLISPNNVINTSAGGNALVITDYAGNLQRLAKIIAAVDQPTGTGVEIVPLRHAVATDVAPLVQRLLEVGGPAAAAAGVIPGALGSGGFTVVAEPRGNALVVRAATPSRLAEVRAAIAQLDRPNALLGPGGGMWVVNLKNADAERLATVLRAAFGAVAGSAPAAAAATAAAVASAQVVAAGGPGARAITAAAAPTTGGFIQADPATNSLVISAAEPLYRQVRQLIDQLDTRRAQVYIESMIVEVSPSDSADFGFQWQGLLGKSGDRFGVVTGTNFSGSGRPSIIDINTSAAQGQINVGAGLNIGLLSVVNGVTSLAAIAKLLQSQSETNIISTPNLITLDNEEAKIVVGENVPFITGQFTGVGGSAGGAGAAANPFQTIERKDVGITLRIRPQVGEGGAVRMTIFQEQSSVKETTAAGTTNAGPSTTKRSIENTVVVDDGAILVLGGLIEDRFVTNRSKVPLLGDLPLLGALFRSESRERRRTNLMVFLRPVVLRDATSAQSLSIDRYDRMRGEQRAAQPERSLVMPINDSPVLPALRPRPGAAPAIWSPLSAEALPRNRAGSTGGADSTTPADPSRQPHH